MRASTWAPAATNAITAPEATRARAIGKPGTFTWQTATSSSWPLIGRQSPEGADARRARTCSGVTPGRSEPATQIPKASSPA